MKKIFLILVFLNVFSLVASEFDRDIVVLNQSRNDKVQVVFKEMMNAYEEEDITEFFSFVSEDRFNQDYMTFYEAIDQDIRVYDILSVDTWVNKITDDGVKRYLYVQWDKRYESSTSDREINSRGYSRFLFDEINGKYKLIELAGNNFWGGSLPEWREEVPQIAGQEAEEIGDQELPDLIISSVACVYVSPSNELQVNVENQGESDAVGPFTVINNDTGVSLTYNGIISVGDTVLIKLSADTSCSSGDEAEVNPSPYSIEESDYTNNTALVP